MPKTTKTAVNQNQNGQYTTTIPKQLADAMELEGKQLEWRVSSGTKLEAKVIDE
jgi:hypothetical protein